MHYKLLPRRAQVFQNREMEKHAAELLIANKQLLHQNQEKENRAAELVIANKELLFQNDEKEKRAAELLVANTELAFQNQEKEKRAAELMSANKELEAFTYISSHDLQEPLRKIQTFAYRIIEKELVGLTEQSKIYFLRIQDAAGRMQSLITDLLAYSRATTTKPVFVDTDLNLIVEEVLNDFAEEIILKKAIVRVGPLCNARIIPFQFRQLLYNLIGNALKFSNTDIAPHLKISSVNITCSVTNDAKLVPGKEYCHVTVADNGIGFDPIYKHRIFELFQQLNGKTKYEGTGIGLAIVKKIVDNHYGMITATSELNKGARFDIFIPVE